MSQKIYSVITGTGNYIPPRQIRNEDFLENSFHGAGGEKLTKPNLEIVNKLQEITTIAERRYVADHLVTSDIGYFAAQDALASVSFDPEELDYIIFAHNFGDVKHGSNRTDMVPSLAARVKHKLGIRNPNTIAYDLPFGCPGWLQGVIQADYYLKSGDAQNILVIGAEVLSRVIDSHDMDSMLYADGAGAAILQAKESDAPVGVLAHKTRSDTLLYSEMLYMGESYNPENENPADIFLKMNGRKLYQYALENVPQAIKGCLEQAGVHLRDVAKLLIHQANGKMDDAIMKRLCDLYDFECDPEKLMPMTISWLGNSSVATVPTLLDLITKGKLPPHEIHPGDIVVFASVGAGMNINAVVYKA